MTRSRTATFALTGLMGAVIGGIFGWTLSPVSAPPADDSLQRDRITALEARLADQLRAVARLQREKRALLDSVAWRPAEAGDPNEAEVPVAPPPGDDPPASPDDESAADDDSAPPAENRSSLRIDVADSLRGEMDRFRKSQLIRMLPEEERWEKARTDLSLSWNQLEDVKRAKTQFDKDLAAAKVSEEVALDDGRTVVATHVDHERVVAAQETYARSLENLLDQEQRKRWRNEGFEGALGGGRATEMRVVTRTADGSFEEEEVPLDD